MAASTLGIYVSIKYIKAVLGVFLLCFSLIFLLDFIEMLRKTADIDNVSGLRIAMLSLFRAPALTEQIFPFAILFGSMSTLLSLSRKLELVVTRSIGMSVWQLLLYPIVIAFLFGAMATTLFNPMAADLKTRADAIESTLLSKGVKTDEEGRWLRQKGDDGEAIIYASKALRQGQELYGLTLFLFDRNGVYRERISASKGTLQPRHWVLEKATVHRSDQKDLQYSNYIVSSYLSPEQVRETFATPDSVPFWSLVKFIELADNAGLPAHKYRLHHQKLLARPLLLCAMVIIAATVSLRNFRHGGIGRMILSGILAGFVLYVVTELAEDLGSVGLVPPVVAAWAPAIVATFLGLTVLLHQEDG